MAKTLECRHGGVLCRSRIVGQSEEEVLAKALEHARLKHKVDLGQAETLRRYLRSLIRDG